MDVCGDLAFQAEESLLVAILGEQEGAQTCVREKMKQMRVELGWSESSALERILIERIVATWLDLHFAELVCNQWKDGTIHEAKYKQHRIDRSHKRHLSAIERCLRPYEKWGYHYWLVSKPKSIWLDCVAK